MERRRLEKTKLTDVTGAFWIADANTYEFMIRVNTATDNGRAWMSILTFTDVEFWVAVTDVTNGQIEGVPQRPGKPDANLRPQHVRLPVVCLAGMAADGPGTSTSPYPVC